MNQCISQVFGQVNFTFHAHKRQNLQVCLHMPCKVEVREYCKNEEGPYSKDILDVVREMRKKYQR